MGKWPIWIFVIGCLACTSPSSVEDTGRFDVTAQEYQKSQNKALPITQRIKLLKDILKTVAPGDTIVPYALYSLSRNHYGLQQYDSVRYYGKRLVARESTKENLINIGKYYHLQGYYHEKITIQFDSAYYYHDLARRAYLNCNDTTKAFGRTVRLGYLQRFQGDYFGAKETLTSALFLKRGKAKNNASANLFSELGIVHMELENIPEAQRFYSQAIATTTSARDRLVYQNNYGVALLEANELTEAKAVLERVLKDPYVLQDSAQWARAIQNLGYAKWKMKESGSLQHFHKSHRISTSINDLNGLTFSHRRFGEYYSTSSPTKAIQHLDTSIILAKAIKRPRLEKDALELLLNIVPKNIGYKDRFIQLTDSLYKQELQVKTQFAYLKYQNQQEKEQLLQLEAATARQEAKLARQETQKTLFITFGGLVLAGSFLLFFLVKQQHKREKLQAVYQTEKRISQELHDGLANDVFGLMTQIQGKKKSNRELLDRLENIYQTSRRISHENAPVKTGTHFKEELNALIDTYQDTSTTIMVKGMTTTEWSLLDNHKCIAIHRAINELLVNMKKHAKASLVLLQFEMQHNQLVVRYKDNGIGLDLNKPQGIGLRSTESRIKAVGGTTIFDIEQEQGTQITFNIPL